jgi:hypothetical protein
MKAKGPARDVGKEAQWRKRVQEWQRSGQTVRAFCQRVELDENQFYGWRRELRKRDAQKRTRGGFVELLRSGAAAGGCGVVLRVGERLKIELERGFDVETLKAALSAVGAGFAS